MIAVPICGLKLVCGTIVTVVTIVANVVIKAAQQQTKRKREQQQHELKMRQLQIKTKQFSQKIALGYFCIIIFAVFSTIAIYIDAQSVAKALALLVTIISMVWTGVNQQQFQEQAKVGFGRVAQLAKDWAIEWTNSLFKSS